MKKINYLLKQAGYFEGRRVDIADILQINHPIWKEDMLLRLNPIEAQKDITVDVVEEYNEFLQDDLLIIGDIERENLTLFLSEKGFYYTGYDDCLKNWGDNFETMINMLVSGEGGELYILEEF